MFQILLYIWDTVIFSLLPRPVNILVPLKILEDFAPNEVENLLKNYWAYRGVICRCLFDLSQKPDYDWFAVIFAKKQW